MAQDLKMRSLKYYFGRTLTANDSPPRNPIVLTLSRKINDLAVSRPRKTVMPGQWSSTNTKLVDYSSTSESESETEIVDKDATPKHLCKMYSKGQKKTVADYARHHGIRKASRRFKVHHTNVIRWKKQRVANLKNPNKRQHMCGQGRKLSYPKEPEEKLVAWILDAARAGTGWPHPFKLVCFCSIR